MTANRDLAVRGPGNDTKCPKAHIALFKEILPSKFPELLAYYGRISRSTMSLSPKPGFKNRYTAAQLLAHPRIANEATVAINLA